MVAVAAIGSVKIGFDVSSGMHVTTDMI